MRNWTDAIVEGRSIYLGNGGNSWIGIGQTAAASAVQMALIDAAQPVAAQPAGQQTELPQGGGQPNPPAFDPHQATPQQIQLQIDQHWQHYRDDNLPIEIALQHQAEAEKLAQHLRTRQAFARMEQQLPHRAVASPISPILVGYRPDWATSCMCCHGTGVTQGWVTQIQQVDTRYLNGIERANQTGARLPGDILPTSLTLLKVLNRHANHLVRAVESTVHQVGRILTPAHWPKLTQEIGHGFDDLNRTLGGYQQNPSRILVDAGDQIGNASKALAKSWERDPFETICEVGAITAEVLLTKKFGEAIASGSSGTKMTGPAPVKTPTPANQAAQRWHAVPEVQKRAVNEAMTEFGTGTDGARLLLDAVRRGDRQMPTTFTREALEAYRDSVQAHYQQLLQQGRDLDVMRLRLEIYRIWLGN